MRVVIFTKNARLEATPWWPVITGAEGLSSILICQQVRKPGVRAVIRRLRTNIKKHGWIFIPYRALVFVGRLFRFGAGGGGRARPTSGGVSVEYVIADSLRREDVIERVREWNPDLGLSLGAPILKRSIFGIPKMGTLNLHLGKVPEFRGAPPAFWELWEGVDRTGATVHWIDDGLDTGPVVAQATAPIYDHDRLSDVQTRLVELSQHVLRQALGEVVEGRPAGVVQEGQGSTFRFPTLLQRFRLRIRRGLRHLTGPGVARRTVRLLGSATAYFLVRPIRNGIRSLARRHPVRIFTFHRVTSLCRDGMTVSPEVFQRQISLIESTHSVVPLHEALAAARQSRRLRKPLAAITFDDGYLSVFEEAFPVMRAEGVPGCVFVCTDIAGCTDLLPHDVENPVLATTAVMNWAQLAELHRAGWTLGAHTASHARLSECDPDALQYELESPLPRLREVTQESRVCLAYPYGGRSDITPAAIERAREMGYDAVLADYGGECMPGGDRNRFFFSRIELGGDHHPLGWRLSVHGMSLDRFRDLWDRPRVDRSV